MLPAIFGLALAAALPAAVAQGAATRTLDRAPIDAAETPQYARVVVRLREGAAAGTDAAVRAQGIARAKSLPLQALRALPGGSAVMASRRPLTRTELAGAVAALEADAQVASVEPDVPVGAGAEIGTNDPWLAQQWALRTAANAAGGAGFRSAWSRSTGSNVTVAVLDTGGLPHPELNGRELPGYDFVTDSGVAGDGGGRDADPTDPGDFCSQAGRGSSWHGTKVASLIAARADNGSGIAGAAPDARVMHVRVLGRCGGWLSDVADAIYWLAGRGIAGVPAPSQRPRVINLSLGGTASCFNYLQESINEANRQGIVVVAAAGNEAQPAISTPANCQGVIAVAAGTAQGDLASYSNYSAQVTLTAPGGGACKQMAGCNGSPTLVAGVNGAQVFQSFGDVQGFNGTSAAAPHVAAAAALLLSADPSLTPAQVRSALVSGARAAPAGSFCQTPGRCGAGLLDADNALNFLRAPLVTIGFGSGITRSTDGAVQTGLVARGAHATLIASAPQGAATTFTWRQLSGPPATVVSGAGSASLGFRAPAEPGLVTFEVTVPAANGQTARGTVTVRANNLPTLPATLPAGSVGRAYEHALPAQDSDADALTYAVVSAPAGVALSAAGRLTWTAPVAGTHALRLRATDPFGQRAEATLSLSIAANTPPTVPGGTLRGRAGSPLSAALGISDAQGGPLTYMLTGAPAGVAISGGTLIWPQPTTGSWTITITARDSGGLAASGRYMLEIAAPNRAPALATTSFAGTAGQPFAAALRATDPDGDAVTFSAAGALPAGLTLNAQGALAWPRPVAGTHRFTIVATDVLGARGSASITLVIAQPNLPPTLGSRVLTVPAATAWTFATGATDPNGDALSYALAGAPAGLSIDAAGTLRWPAPVAGRFRFQVLARDPAGLAAAATYELTVVAPVNRAPVVGSGSIVVSLGTGISLRVFAFDPDGHPVTLTASGVPAGVSFSNGTLQGTPTTRGTFTIRLAATDPAGARGEGVIALTVR